MTQGAVVVGDVVSTVEAYSPEVNTTKEDAKMKKGEKKVVTNVKARAKNAVTNAKPKAAKSAAKNRSKKSR